MTATATEGHVFRRRAHRSESAARRRRRDPVRGLPSARGIALLNLGNGFSKCWADTGARPDTRARPWKQTRGLRRGVLDSAPRLTLVSLGNQSAVGPARRLFCLAHDHWGLSRPMGQRLYVRCGITSCQRGDGRPTALSPANGWPSAGSPPPLSSAARFPSVAACH
jgi:hypothetical protein